MPSERPIKVLDLACGTMHVLPTLVVQHPGKIEYTGVDRSGAPLSTYPGKDHIGYEDAFFIEAFYNLHGIPFPKGTKRHELTESHSYDRRIAGSLIGMHRRATVIYHQRDLDFGKPRALRAIIAGAVGRKKFDQIHLHAIDVLKANPNALRSLRVLGHFLRKGGRIFNADPNSSAILPILDGSRVSDQGKSDARFNENRRRIVKAAAKAGFELERYAYRGFLDPLGTTGRRKTKWISEEGDHSTIEREVSTLSEYWEDLHHLVVLRKL